MNLASIIDPHPDDAVALISRGKPTTYGTLREQVGGLRGGLVELGLEPGDRIGIICANTRYFVVSYLAALGCGLVAVPLNPQSPAAELQTELSAIGARAVIVGPSGKHGFAGVDRSALPVLEHVVASSGIEVPGGALDLDGLLAHEPAPLVDREADDLAVLIFTSGTAGAPKAAMLSHGNLLANIDQMLATPGLVQGPDDVGLGVLPLFHIFGLNVVLGVALRVGSSVLLIERFDPVSCLEAIAKWGVTAIAGAPTMWTAWAGLPESPTNPMASVRLATSGAAKLEADTASRVQARYGLAIAEGYGLTEASPVVTATVGLDARPGSIGVPLPGVEVRLVDPDGDDVLVGDEGEIWVKGPNVFRGYWNDPTATRGALADDGWLRTGDIAVVSDDGLLYLVDRVKDLIIVSGFNVFPAEVEDVLIDHPGVAAAAVVGVPHPYSGEAVKAYVVVRDGWTVEEDDIIGFCAERLARYKCPEKVMFVEELPQGLAGKVLKRALR